jgi:hypothetical protein
MFSVGCVCIRTVRSIFWFVQRLQGQVACSLGTKMMQTNESCGIVILHWAGSPNAYLLDALKWYFQVAWCRRNATLCEYLLQSLQDKKYQKVSILISVAHLSSQELSEIENQTLLSRFVQNWHWFRSKGNPAPAPCLRVTKMR